MIPYDCFSQDGGYEEYSLIIKVLDEIQLKDLQNRDFLPVRERMQSICSRYIPEGISDCITYPYGRY